MKGISLPVNAIVIIAVAVLVLAVVAAFFVGAIGSGWGTITLEQDLTVNWSQFTLGASAALNFNLPLPF